MRAPFSLVVVLFALCLAPLTLAATQPLVAVLDFRATDLELSAGELSLLTEGARKVAVEQLGETYGVITRENLQDLLSAHGKTLERCQGACETETGRMLGAELVVTGHVTQAFGEIHLTVKIHRTAPPTLLATELGKTTNTKGLPSLTHDVCTKLLQRLKGSDKAGTSVTVPSATPAPRAATRTTNPPPQALGVTSTNKKPEELFRIPPLGDSSHASTPNATLGSPALSWIDFRGALRVEKRANRRERDLGKTVKRVTRQLRRTKKRAKRAKLLEERIRANFDLIVSKADGAARSCWLERSRWRSDPRRKPVDCSTDIELEDLSNPGDFIELGTEGLSDSLRFINGYLNWLYHPKEVIRFGGLDDLSSLASNGHVESLLIVGEWMLYDGDLYNSARLLAQAVQRTKAHETNGAFARYLLAHLYMVNDHLGSGEELTRFVVELDPATSDAESLFDTVKQALATREDWRQVRRTGQELLERIEQESLCANDYTCWVGPVPDGMSADEVN